MTTERTKEVNKTLAQPAFDAAWAVFQNTKIDLVADSDDETRRCLNNAIATYVVATERTLLRLLWPLAVLGAFALGLAGTEIVHTLLRYAPIIG